MNADGTGLKLLLGEKGKEFPGFSLSPDGKTLAFIRSAVGMSRPELGFLALADGKTTFVDHDRAVTTPGWTPDGKYLYFVSPSNGGFRCTASPGGGRTPSGLPTSNRAVRRLPWPRQSGFCENGSGQPLRVVRGRPWPSGKPPSSPGTTKPGWPAKS
jgi:dipeptidyl aminopeptidase/acylaminoacyl peptidase